MNYNTYPVTVAPEQTPPNPEAAPYDDDVIAHHRDCTLGTITLVAQTEGVNPWSVGTGGFWEGGGLSEVTGEESPLSPVSDEPSPSPTTAERKQAPQTIVEKNREYLNQSPLGWALNEAYSDFLKLYEHNFPDVSEVPIVPVPVGSPSIASANAEWSPQGNRFEVRLRVGDWDEVSKVYEEVDSFAPSIREEVAALYGITPEQATPQLIAVTSLLHEFSHIIDYKMAGSGEVWEQIKQRDRAVFQNNDPLLAKLYALLPKSATELNTPEGRLEVAAMLPELEKQLGISMTVESAIDQRARAHRRIPRERRADSRAVNVIKSNPVLFNRLVDATGLGMQLIRNLHA